MPTKNTKKETLTALRDSLIIRKKLTQLVKVLSLQSQKRLEKLEDELHNARDEEQQLKAREAIREEKFNDWLILQECERVNNKGAELMDTLRTANTIYPDYMSEYEERRVLMGRAMGACNVLQDELQYIADSVYADKNKFTPLVLEIEALFNSIRALRQADNRFLKTLKDKTGAAESV